MTDRTDILQDRLDMLLRYCPIPYSAFFVTVRSVPAEAIHFHKIQVTEMGGQQDKLAILLR